MKNTLKFIEERTALLEAERNASIESGDIDHAISIGCQLMLLIEISHNVAIDKMDQSKLDFDMEIKSLK